MTDISQLTSFAKLTSKSFHQQKNFIKKVLIGKVTHCPQCQHPLDIYLTDNGESSIRCKKRCTDIELDCS
ncbi:hypothetical protein tinsulaeT_03900 [Thalassotalea insulae]|uniref:Uncharacterized protein n=1 Tax=Thalassotalea insulae TaxID=2056778 RepID=A0ABQ6GRJ5_9GAMM|nr:hypothetical protein [Thalassotalea insulae]GLX77050.1 hypothetical protein tinsulaeT_03900 [Thalassotalea insulae]